MIFRSFEDVHYIFISNTLSCVRSNVIKLFESTSQKLCYFWGKFIWNIIVHEGLKLYSNYLERYSVNVPVAQQINGICYKYIFFVNENENEGEWTRSVWRIWIRWRINKYSIVPKAMKCKKAKSCFPSVLSVYYKWMSL